MGRQLQYTVFVPGKNGEVVKYSPGDDVPAAVAKKITNPKAWAVGEEAEAAETTSDAGDSGDTPPAS